MSINAIFNANFGRGIQQSVFLAAINLIISELERIRNIITPIAQDYGVKIIKLFGSRAEGSYAEHSDSDFLISKGKISSLLAYISFVNTLEDTIRTHVDVEPDTSNDKEFIERINKDAVVIYEQL